MALPPPACRVAGGGFFLPMKALLTQSAKHSLQVLISAHPGHIIIGTRTIKCAVFAERGVKWEGDGGQIQQRLIKAQVPCSALPDSEIVNATTDATRPVQFTHQETGKVYQLSTDNAPLKDPTGTYWHITGTQVTKK